ncbi:amino acid adenylation domain-containing protein [Wukongibacter sp. M2B1]|uniref:non-ribosomal peptide synthetase n=1 Tax=Wukongibacter sp. M2B1 TaxID=3088895 RepID=UPI003D7A17AD
MFKKTDVKDIYSLSPMQEGMLFHYILDKKTSAYFEQTTFTLKGELDIEAFEKTFNKIVEKYDVLRTVFTYRKTRKPRQIVLKSRQSKIYFEDICWKDEDSKDIFLEQYKSEDRERGFDLEKDIPMRISIIKTSQYTYKIVWSFHHIIMDGWCLGIIIKDFFDIYGSLKGKEDIILEPARPYSTYIKWLEKQDMEEGINCWRDYLEGYEGQALIPKVRRAEVYRYQSKDYSIKLSKELTQELKEMAKRSQATVNTIFQAAWGVLLCRYNNTEDVVFGSVVSGRPADIPGIEGMVGLFINTVPVRIKYDNEDTFSGLIKKVQRETIKSEKHNYIPLAEMQASSQAKQSLISHIIAFENYPIDEGIKRLVKGEKLGFSIGEVENFEQTNYDFVITVMPGEEMIVRLKYNDLVYDEAFIRRIGEHILNVIRQIIANSQIEIRDIEILARTELEEILQSFNDTSAEYPRDETIQRLFEQQVERTPNNRAVVFKDKSITYRELNEKVNNLARRLRKEGVQPETIVGIIVEPTIEMIVGILAVLKAGGAYLPIDPDYPRDRIDYMLKDSNAYILLTQYKWMEKLRFEGFEGKVINLEDRKIYEENSQNLEMTNKSTDLAYVIYTSGSTGKPKGVMIEHRSLINLCTWHNSYYSVTSKDRASKYAGFGFDASVWEIFPYLTIGAAIYMIPNEIRLDINRINEFFENNKITISFLPTQMYERFKEVENSTLRVLLAGGDKLKDYKSCNYKLINNYGPTENTVVTTSYEVARALDNIPIGKPIWNTRVYIVDKYNRIQPIGVPGELCISGEGVARGYLNRPEATKEKFIENRFAKGTRMYKTGDLARWLPDGNIEFLGRIDNQVKIRGYRIELGEIENNLLKHRDIREAVVEAKENERKEKYLCGYIVADKELKELDLKKYLSRELPDYMIPAYFIQMEVLPITQNGKVDRKNLPKPDIKSKIGLEYEEPSNGIEEALVVIWQDILSIDEKIGTKDNFFDLGGHSLMVTMLAARIHKELGVEIPLKEIFKNPYIKGISQYISEAQESNYGPIKPAEKRESYILSSAQKRMYMLNQISRETINYNVPTIMRIKGFLDKERLKEVFKRLIMRHEVLRTGFKMIDDEPVQIVCDEVDFKIEYMEWKEEEIEKGIKEFIRPFDLRNAPLLRIALAKLSEDEHIFLLDMHHIITDAVSVGILMDEFIKGYEGHELPEISLQYKDYALWQRDIQNEERIKKQEKYWLDRFKGEIPALDIQTDYTRPVVQNFNGDEINFKIDKELTDKLKNLAKANEVTLYMVLLAAYNILLYKYTGQEDIIVGSPIAGRFHDDMKNIVGMFVNTLAMRNNPDSNKTFEGFLREVKENALKAYENQDYQFEELVEKLNIKRNMGRNPLFDTMFMLQNVDIKELKIKGLEIKPFQFKRKTSKFDISLRASEMQGEIKFNLEYSVALFKKDTMDRLSKHFINILKKITEKPEIKLMKINMLPREEESRVLYDFNNTKAEYPMDRTIHELFQEQVGRTPDSTAVVFGEKKLSYSELNRRSNQLARILREKNVGVNTIVGIISQPSIEMIMGILAVLKAGGAYLPIDPEFPENRIKYILEDSGSKLVLTQSSLVDMIKSSFEAEVIDLEYNNISKEDSSNLESISNANDLVYVIYTSGTTGKAKGTFLTNRNLANYTDWFIETSGLNNRDKGLLLSSFAFDLGYTTLYSSILVGGELHLVSKDTYLYPEKLMSYLEENRISFIKLTPSLYSTLVDSHSFQSKLNWFLRLIVLGGEEIRAKDVEKTYKMYDRIQIMNHYGPTETTIGAIAQILDCNKIEEFKERPTLGKPINNTRVYILDKYKNPQPIGVPGELCISGDGLAKGYLNRPELTAEKFIENPFLADTKIYKTGDLARWLPDGTIEFLGRIDNQVKIRGYRVEPGEIEGSILKHKDIKEAVVVVIEENDKEKYLCGYIVANKKLAIAELRQDLSKVLPDYMIPAYFIQVDSIPLTPNGKVDRKKLPIPDRRMHIGTQYEKPRNKTEESLVEIWQEVLSIEDRIGIKDNFFELGGHSLKATSMVSKIYRQFGVEVPLFEIFKGPNIKMISEYIESANKSIYSQIVPVEMREYYPLSSAQQRMFVLNQFEDKSISYNMPAILILEADIDKNLMKEIFNKLLKRHDSLRTSFHMVDGEPVQQICDELDLDIEYIETMEEELEEKIDGFIRPFDLDKAPLLRVALIKLSKNKHVLMLDMHHIIADGVSRGILIEEFMKLYRRKELSDTRLQYKDYALWQRKLQSENRIKKQEEYWLSRFKGELPVLNIQTDYVRPAIKNFEGAEIGFELDKELTDNLEALAARNEATLYMVLLSAYNTLIYRYTGQEDIIVGSPIAGRSHADLENIIGMFVNTLAMRNKPTGSKTFKELLAEVKKNALEAYENQDYQFEELVEKLNIKRDMGRNPIFDTMLVLQNMERKELEIEGLKMTPYGFKNKTSKFDITLNAFKTEAGMRINLEYSTSLFKKETIERLSSHFINILKNIVRQSELKLGEIKMLSQEEEAQLVYEFNTVEEVYPKDETIHGLFEEQVMKTPDNTAVICGRDRITYRELNEKSNQLAAKLLEMGVENDTIVGIMMNQSIELIIGIMGILKAGGAYLPIDPGYPGDRIDYMIGDSKAEIIITDGKNTTGRALEININDDEIYKESKENMGYINNPKSAAYVIYTSGTTGKPKGVVVEHRNAVNTLTARKRYYNMEEEAVSLQLFSHSFDGFITSFFTPIISGARVILLEEEGAKDLESIKKRIIENRVTHFISIPALYKAILENLSRDESKSIRVVTLAGDKISSDILGKTKEKNPNIEIVNEYGVTEGAVASTIGRNLREGLEKNIGKPMANTKIYILDKENNVMPIGALGELCIGGAGVARGYLNRPELTSKKFIKNPFAKGVIYKTGDLARWMSDGSIEFIGRADQQVKIRGYRIELEEIEKHLILIDGIKEAIVVTKGEEEERYICAYVVLEKEEAIHEIKEKLKKELPHYMVPARIIEIDEIPLTPNGKIDRIVLEQRYEDVRDEDSYVAPRNKIERKLVEIWGSILSKKEAEIGIDDNFFEIGGHSLKATTLTTLIEKELNVRIQLNEIFKTPTIRAIGKCIERADKDRYFSIEPAKNSKYYPLSTIQRRMFIINQRDEGNLSYNIPTIFYLEGMIDEEKIEKAFRRLIERHEALRTGFEIVNDDIMQRIYEKVDFRLKYSEREGYKSEEIISRFIRPFSLKRPPLLRVELVRLVENEYLLMLDMHHIIADGVSAGVLMEEFIRAYNDEPLEDLGLQYKDYSVWQNKQLYIDRIKKQEEFWLRTFNGEVPSLNLPLDFPRPNIRSYEGSCMDFYIDSRLTKLLKDIVICEGATLYMGILSIYNILLSKLSGQEDIVIGTIMAGRTHADLQKIVGPFVNTLALRNYPLGNKSFREFLREVRSSTIEAFENQDYQFEDIIKKLDKKVELGRNPLFDVLFMFQNTDIAEKEIAAATTSLDFTMRPYDYEKTTSKFDMKLGGCEEGERLFFSIEYSTKLFKKETIERFIEYLKRIILLITENPDMIISEIELVDEEKRERFKIEFNDDLENEF